MSWKRVGLSFVVFVMLSGLWLLDTLRREAATITKSEERALLNPALTPDWIDKVEVEATLDGEAMPTMVLEARPKRRRAGDPLWWVSEPVVRPANDRMVQESLLANMRTAKRSNIFEGTPTEGNGLAQPTLIARLHHRHPELPSPFELRVGAPSSFTGNYFAEASDMPGMIFTLSKASFGRLAAPFSIYVDLRLLALPPGDRIVSLALRNSFGLTSLTAHENGWRVVGPGVDEEADPSAVEQFLVALSERRASRSLEQDAVDAALRDAPASIELAVSDGETTETLSVGARIEGEKPTYLARRSDTDYILMLPPILVEEMQLSPEHWTQRTLVAADADDFAQVRIKDGLSGPELTFRRSSTKDPWLLVGRPGRMVDAAKFGQMLGRLARLRATGVLALPPDKAEEARAMIFARRDTRYEITLADGTEIRLRVAIDPSRSADENAYVLAGEAADARIHLVPLKLGFDLQVNPTSLLVPRIMAGVANAVEVLKLQTSADSVELRRDRNELAPGWPAEGLPRQIADELGKRLMELAWLRPGEPADAAGLDAMKPLAVIDALGADGKLLERAEFFQPLLEKDALEVRVRLLDGTVVYAERSRVTMLDRLMARGRSLAAAPKPGSLATPNVEPTATPAPEATPTP